MFILHIGDTPNELTQKEFRLLAEKTEGYVSLLSTAVVLINPRI